jgi:hypothetical protein
LTPASFPASPIAASTIWLNGTVLFRLTFTIVLPLAFDASNAAPGAVNDGRAFAFSICGLADGAAWPVKSALTKFRQDFLYYIKSGKRAAAPQLVGTH